MSCFITLSTLRSWQCWSCDITNCALCNVYGSYFAVEGENGCENAESIRIFGMVNCWTRLVQDLSNANVTAFYSCFVESIISIMNTAESWHIDCLLVEYLLSLKTFLSDCTKSVLCRLFTIDQCSCLIEAMYCVLPAYALQCSDHSMRLAVALKVYVAWCLCIWLGTATFLFSCVKASVVVRLEKALNLIFFESLLCSHRLATLN